MAGEIPESILSMNWMTQSTECPRPQLLQYRKQFAYSDGEACSPSSSRIFCNRLTCRRSTVSSWQHTQGIIIIRRCYRCWHASLRTVDGVRTIARCRLAKEQCVASAPHCGMEGVDASWWLVLLSQKIILWSWRVEYISDDGTYLFSSACCIIYHLLETYNAGFSNKVLYVCRLVPIVKQHNSIVLVVHTIYNTVVDIVSAAAGRVG